MDVCPCDWCGKPVNLNTDDFTVTGPESEYVKCAACSAPSLADVAAALKRQAAENDRRKRAAAAAAFNRTLTFLCGEL